MKPFILYCLLVFSVLGTACSKFEFSTADNSELVVEGWIENGKPPRVILTYSVPFFADVDSVSLLNYAALWAKVTVSTDDQQEVLTLSPREEYFPPYVYVGSEIRGEVGKTYRLTVELSGKTYTATTEILPAPQLESLEYEALTDTSGFLTLTVKKQSSPVENYRVFSWLSYEGEGYFPTHIPFFSTQNTDDEFYSHKIYKGGVSDWETLEDLAFDVQSKVVVKVCTITRENFEYWQQVEKEKYNSGNPFAASNRNLKGNVEGALGVWYGFSSSDIVYYPQIVWEKR